MLTDNPRKLMIPDSSGHGNHIPVLINYNKHIKDCKYIMFMLPGGKKAIIDKDNLRAIMFMIATSEEQEKMAARRFISAKVFKKNVTVTFDKDTTFHRGQEMTLPITFQIPVSVQDNIVNNGEFKTR